MDFEEFWEQNKVNIIYFSSIIVFVLILSILFFRYNSKTNYYQKKVKYKESRLIKFKQYAKEYQKLKKTTGVKDEKLRLKGTLLSYFGNVTKKLGLDQKVTNMKPLRGEKGKKIIEIKLEKIMLEDATKLLFDVEKKSNLALRIKRFQIRKRVDHPKLLDMSLQVEVL